MGKECKQLSVEDRSVIAVGLGQGLSLRAIAGLLDRPVSTVSRELNRNAGAQGYVPQEAVVRCKKRKFRRKRLLSNASSLLWQEVQRLMCKGWSPEQIAGKLKIMHPE